jgi:hypothetical protein
MKEHFYIIRAYEQDGLRQFQIAGDMEDVCFMAGTVLNTATNKWETAYDDDENEENDLQISNALANAINDLQIKLFKA